MVLKFHCLFEQNLRTSSSRIRRSLTQAQLWSGDLPPLHHIKVLMEFSYFSMLWMAVLSQSGVKSSRQENASSRAGSNQLPYHNNSCLSGCNNLFYYLQDHKPVMIVVEHPRPYTRVPGSYPSCDSLIFQNYYSFCMIIIIIMGH